FLRQGCFRCGILEVRQAPPPNLSPGVAMVARGWSHRSFLLAGGLIVGALLVVTLLTNAYRNALRAIGRVGGSTDATSLDGEHCGPIRTVSLRERRTGLLHAAVPPRTAPPRPRTFLPRWWAWVGCPT